MLRPLFPKFVAAVCVLSVSMASAQTGAGYGAESPQAVVAAIQKAMAAKDLAATLRHVTPAGREATVKDLLGGTLVAMAMFDPDVPTVVGKPPTKAGLETQRKNYRTAQGHLRQALKPHGLDILVGKPVTPESEAALMAAISAALPKTDSAVLASSVLSAMDKIAPIVGMPRPEPPPLFTFSAVTEYQVQGDRATAKAGTDTLEFERVQSRWYIKLPATSR